MDKKELDSHMREGLLAINQFLCGLIGNDHSSRHEELEDLLSVTLENLKTAEKTVITEREEQDSKIKKRTQELLQNRAAIMRMMKNAERVRRESEAANASKSEFLANMSHEIRTPMNGIIGAADMMGFTELSKDQNKFLEIISGSSKSLLNIINDILDLSKIEADRVELEQIAMNIHETLYKTVEMLRISAEKKGLKINLNIEENSPVYIVGDPTRVGQIMINLVSNAVKFTEEGSISISMRKGKIEDFLYFSVSDTGIGIAKNKQKEIFKSFSQSDSTMTRKHGGTGLGLTITKKLINMMDGEIEVESEPGRGSTFFFHIRAPEISGQDIPVADKNALSPIPEIEDNQLRKIKVLIAEDHPVNMKVIRFMLSRKGCDIHEAENGEQAVAQFLKIEPDMILMDMQMPVMNGLEATKKIRKLEKELSKERTTIAALTANAMKDDRARAKAAGMDYFLSKPVTYEELSDIIDKTPEKKSLFDYRGLVEMFSGNEEITKELLREFVQGTAPHMSSLEEYIGNGDFESVRISAHTMKGQLLNLRAVPAAEMFAQLERAGKDKNKKAIESICNNCRTSMADLIETIDRVICE